jgi:hypothetical protein
MALGIPLVPTHGRTSLARAKGEPILLTRHPPNRRVLGRRVVANGVVKMAKPFSEANTSVAVPRPKPWTS